MASRYKKIKLVDGTTKNEHVLVWELHNGPVPVGMVVHHINNNPRDNRIENLEVMTRSAHTKLHHDQGDLFSGADVPKVLRKGGIGKRKIGPEGTVWCTCCQLFIATSYFHRSSDTWTGYATVCKPCRSTNRKSGRPRVTGISSVG